MYCTRGSARTPAKSLRQRIDPVELPAVSGEARRRSPRRGAAVLRQSCAADRPASLCHTPGATAQQQMGGLLQASIRRVAVSSLGGFRTPAARACGIVRRGRHPKIFTISDIAPSGEQRRGHFEAERLRGDIRTAVRCGRDIATYAGRETRYELQRRGIRRSDARRSAPMWVVGRALDRCRVGARIGEQNGHVNSVLVARGRYRARRACGKLQHADVAR